MSTAFETRPMLIHSGSNNFFTAFIRLYALEAAGIYTFSCTYSRSSNKKQKSSYFVQQLQWQIFYLRNLLCFYSIFQSISFYDRNYQKKKKNIFYSTAFSFAFYDIIASHKFLENFYITFFFCFFPKKYVCSSR